MPNHHVQHPLINFLGCCRRQCFGQNPDSCRTSCLLLTWHRRQHACFIVFKFIPILVEASSASKIHHVHHAA